ncbi:hypothetical protein VTN96DRAFT_6114 [Rasamsonia emersonii]
MVHTLVCGVQQSNHEIAQQGKRLSWPSATPEVQGVRLARDSSDRTASTVRPGDSGKKRRWRASAVGGRTWALYRWAGSAGARKSGQGRKQVTWALSKPDRAIRSPSGAGGEGRQMDRAMAAVSRAPLTGSSYT